MMKKVCIIFVLALMSLSPIVLNSCSDSENTATEIQAGIMSEDFIKGYVKYPADCTFSDKNVVTTKPNDFIVITKVEAKNGFGVTSILDVNIEMRFRGGDWTDNANWAYGEMDIHDESTGETSIHYGV